LESDTKSGVRRLGAIAVVESKRTLLEMFTGSRDRLVQLAARYSIPASYSFREFVLAGGLLSYGPGLTWAYLQAGI